MVGLLVNAFVFLLGWWVGRGKRRSEARSRFENYRRDLSEALQTQVGSHIDELEVLRKQLRSLADEFLSERHRSTPANDTSMGQLIGRLCAQHPPIRETAEAWFKELVRLRDVKVWTQADDEWWLRRTAYWLDAWLRLVIKPSVEGFTAHAIAELRRVGEKPDGSYGQLWVNDLRITARSMTSQYVDGLRDSRAVWDDVVLPF